MLKFTSFYYLFLKIVSVTLILIVALSVYIDPLWLFTHTNRYNSHQIAFDERQQKSNFLAARENNYDAIIMGSSRTTFLPASDVPGYKVFNLAVNAMLPEEYTPYTAFFKRHNRRTPRLIIIGVDFFATNGNFHGYGYLAPKEYFNRAESPLWRYGVLLSRDSLLYSIRNIRQVFKNIKLDYYDRNGVKDVARLPLHVRKQFIQKDLVTFRREFYGSNYSYRDLTSSYYDLIRDNENSKFIVFTTPDSFHLWRVLIEQGRLEDYIRWIGDLVEVFGEVHDFMGETAFTTNNDYYMDAHHFYPEAGKILLTEIMSGKSGPYATLVTKATFPAYAALLRKRYNTSTR